MRKRKIKLAVQNIIKVLNDISPTRIEILEILGDVLINIGYTIYFQKEIKQSPPGKITAKEANKLYLNRKTLGTSLMKLGFDFQGSLLERVREDLKKEGKNE
jgi:hypothetical protein